MVFSTIVHVVTLLTLALVVQKAPEKERPRVIVAGPSDTLEQMEDLAIEALPDTPEQATELVDTAIALPDVDIAPDVPVEASAADLDAAPLAVELTDFSAETALQTDLLASIGAVGGQSRGFGGRSGAQRAQLVRVGGARRKASRPSMRPSCGWPPTNSPTAVGPRTSLPARPARASAATQETEGTATLRA